MRADIHIRDPIHGSIMLSRDELAVVETPVYQRLRGIRQMGFADQAFPGATHTRFSHGLGAMEMAGRVFDAVFPPADLVAGEGKPCPFSSNDRRRLRKVLRLAVLLHDIGHAPLSHASEGWMPDRRQLQLEGFSENELDQRATHEDFTVKLILESTIAEVIQSSFAEEIDPKDVCQLISGRFSERSNAFFIDGIDYGPILNQIVSGELDADRLDYLPRDSFYAGVKYGKFDDLWLLSNLSWHVVDDQAFLALSHRAIFAFEDFLLSRYHMFVSVYYHHTAVGLDTMLARYHEEVPDEVSFPVSVDDYLAFDDISLWSQLRRSTNRWARRIASRSLYRRLLELNIEEGMPDLSTLENLLRDASVDYFISRDEGVLSRYYGADNVHPIYVVNVKLGQATPIERYSKVYERYSKPTRLTRLYCEPKQLRTAERCLQDVLRLPRN